MSDAQCSLPYVTNFIRREWFMAMCGNRFSVIFEIQTLSILWNRVKRRV